MTDINKGIVIRGISDAGAFVKEELDFDGRLTNASVNSVEGSTEKNIEDVMKGMNKDNFKKGYAFTTVKKIKQNQGRVMCAPDSDNKNHCQIFGLPLKDANNLFSNVIPW